MINLSKQISNKIEPLNLTKKSYQEREDKIRELKNNDSEFRLLIEKQELRVFQILNPIFPYYQLIGPLYESIFFILPISISIIVKLLIEHSRHLFKLYFARACFGIVLKQSSDEIIKAKYFITGLLWYNRFLKHTINLKINNIDTISEKILIKSSLDNNETLISLAKSFEQIDGFEPLRHISAIFPYAETEKILTKESLTTRIQESSDLIIPIVTTIITVITTFFFKSVT
jgi:hypothetical protein